MRMSEFLSQDLIAAGIADFKLFVFIFDADLTFVA